MVDAGDIQIEAFRKQIIDSENNLKAQYDVLMHQQQVGINT
jgi:hypothetical protein